MDKKHRFLIFILLMIIPLGISAQQNLTFQEVDRQTYDLYQKGEWKELIRVSNKALNEGIDYGYLRVRAGVACFELKKYAQAVLHFKKALDFNETDAFSGEYLYWSYLELNKSKEAYEVYDKLPELSKENLKKSLPMLKEVNVDQGFIGCNQMEIFDTLDLDGPDNLYGETDITQDGYFFDGGLSWGFKKGFNVYGAYSFFKINKDKVAQIGDTMTVDDLYPLKQHQIYLNGSIPLGNGFSVLPAFNFLMERYETIAPQLASDSLNYQFPVKKFSNNYFIGYLSVTKDFNILVTTLFAAYSNLNSTRQFQGGVQATVFPFGNLNFYLTSKLISHLNDEENHFIYDQMVGFRLTRNIWGEVDATFGRMQNYYENNAFIVYNLTDEMKFKGSAKLIWMVKSRWEFTAAYLYILREGNYVHYHSESGLDPVPVTVTKDFSNNIYLLGLKWKF
jgi:tetratricopeptide (TPR) repeat protein